jgi:hypothetical protein
MATIIENEDRRVAGFIERLSTTNAGSQAPTRLMNRSLNTNRTATFLVHGVQLGDGSVCGPNANPRRF